MVVIYLNDPSICFHITICDFVAFTMKSPRGLHDKSASTSSPSGEGSTSLYVGIIFLVSKMKMLGLFVHHTANKSLFGFQRTILTSRSLGREYNEGTFASITQLIRAI